VRLQRRLRTGKSLTFEKVAARYCHPAGGKIDLSDRPTRRSEASVKGKTTLENFTNSSTPTFSTTSAMSGHWLTHSSGHSNVGCVRTTDMHAPTALGASSAKAGGGSSLSRAVPERPRVIDIWARVLPLPRYSEWPGQPATAARSASDSRPSRLIVNRCGSRSDHWPAPRSTVKMQDVGVRPGRRGMKGG
jgi:hypothetical protein